MRRASWRCVIKKVRVPADDRLHRREGASSGAHATARARPSSTRSTWRTARSASRRWCRWPAATARRWWWAASTRTAGHGGHPRSASWRSRSARYELLTEKYGMPARGPDLRPAGVPVRHRRRATTSARAVETIEGVRADQAALPASARRSSASPTSPSACPPRAARCSTPSSSTTASRRASTIAIVNTEKLERYAVDPRGGAQALPRTCSTTAGADPVAAFAAHFREQQAGRRRRRARCRSTSGSPRYIIEGSQGRARSRTSTLKLEKTRAARDHQRPADEGHGRGRPALQRQRAHRRRGAPDAPRR